MSQPLQVIESRQELLEWRRNLRTSSLGFVPTMGALHRGHGELLRQAKANCESTILSIFINPTQFGPTEDLAKYPKTIEADLNMARLHGVDAVFLPSVQSIYPEGYSTYVEETAISQELCGVYRPGHFRGVCTIVLKLFNLIRPTAAYFGLKDAQQFFVIERMIKDLDLEDSIKIYGVSTVRESDGLAMSSRNSYLTPEERRIAPLLYRTLSQVKEALTTPAISQIATLSNNSEPSLRRILDQAAQNLQANHFKVQYFDLYELPKLVPKKGNIEFEKAYLLAIAAYLGSTRLIDNVLLNPDKLNSNLILSGWQR